MAEYRTFRMTHRSDAQAVATGVPHVSDLYVDPVTNTLVLVDDAHAVALRVGQRIHTFFGEWYLDTELGVQWLDQVMATRPGQGVAVAEVGHFEFAIGTIIHLSDEEVGAAVGIEVIADHGAGIVGKAGAEEESDVGEVFSAEVVE